ncbi:pectinesterase family protein [Flavilitoribacter nigricans]|nr:pectinesterase family protein [Flavilitoribacter nigricans]
MTLFARFSFRILLCGLLLCSCWNGPLFGQEFTPDIIVALDGTGDYSKIQAAIDAVPNNSEVPTIIYIKRGLYDTEKLIVPATKTNVVLIGESREETIISYHLHDCSSGGYQGRCPAEDAQLWSGDNIRTSATFTVMGDDFRAENLTIQNTAGPVGQAQAVTIRADRVVFRNCNLTSYQDTLYFWSSGRRSYFENCLILGRTDYIYGGGIAFFQACEIRSWGGGWITAPSTHLEQFYGFVFNACKLTYALNSPRAGDDGATVALGRPWNDYPKVAWLYCDMTEKIDPLGWPTKWNMAYADTSPDLHLYEYQNTGAGADMSGRADWVGIRALTAEEAEAYTLPMVVSGNDGWDPTAEAPVIPNFFWVGADTTTSWKAAANWDPQGVPDTAQAAYVEGPYLVTADGGHFAADLHLSQGASLEIIAPSKVTLLTVAQASLTSEKDLSLEGRIRTKDSLFFRITDTLNLYAELIGVHSVDKSGNGNLVLNESSPDFTGYWNIINGQLTAATTKALGNARGVRVDSTGTLRVEASGAFFPETPLYVLPGGQLHLLEDIIVSEFYLGDSLQTVGEYSAETHPEIISGPGLVKVGRPGSFTFIGGANGNWDEPTHFQPALLPEAGETVTTKIEMETTPFIFPADIIVQQGGRIRLRGAHRATGTIYLEAGTSLGYATSGTGFSLDAPLEVLGDISLNMNSRAVPDHSMYLGGPISGNARITAYNLRADTENRGTVILAGDNRDFTGTWDLKQPPSSGATSVIAFEGVSANAFGQGLIEVSFNNRVVLAHEQSAGETLRVNLILNGRIQLDTVVRVDRAIINGSELADGLYNAITQPGMFVGSGTLLVGIETAVREVTDHTKIYVSNRHLYIEGKPERVSIYDLSGKVLLQNRASNRISLEHLVPGLYLVHYRFDGQQGVQKVLVK